MDDSRRVIDYVKDIAEYITTTDGKISASALLERFLFTSDMQYAPIGKLSGGEKRRLYLLGVLAENANVLLFDEAGNNLDIPTLTILEDYLNSFNGIVITVFHDRYFLDNVADRILEMDGNGHVSQYEGGYTDYLKAREERGGQDSADGIQARELSKTEKAVQETVTSSDSLKTWKQPSRKLKFTYKEQREYETIDDDIAALEQKLESIERQIEANATNSVKLRELINSRTSLEKHRSLTILEGILEINKLKSASVPIPIELNPIIPKDILKVSAVTRYENTEEQTLVVESERKSFSPALQISLSASRGNSANSEIEEWLVLSDPEKQVLQFGPLFIQISLIG